MGKHLNIYITFRRRDFFLLSGAFCLLLVGEGIAAARPPAELGPAKEPVEVRVAALSNWSPVLLRFDPADQGVFDYSAARKQTGWQVDIRYTAGTDEFVSDGVRGIRGGSPLFMIGQRRVIDAGILRIPSVDGMETLCGWRRGKPPALSAGGLFYALVSPEVWDAMQGEISPEDAASARPHHDDRRNEFLYFVRAAPENEPHLAQALRLHEGREVVLALAWIPGALRLGPVGDQCIELRDLVFDALPEKTSEARRLLARLDYAKIDGFNPDGSEEANIHAVIKHFGRKADPVKMLSTQAVSGNSAANEMLHNRWVLSLGDRVKKVEQTPPYQWGMEPFEEEPQWGWHLHWYRAFFPLAAAFEETGNPDYAQKWREITMDWVRQNPPGTPISWRSLVSAIRTRSIIPQIKTFYNQPVLEDADRMALLNLVADHADYLADPIQYHPANNWGATETASLLQIATEFPEFLRSEEWRKEADRRRESARRELVNPDGSTDEMVTGYHISVLDSLIRGAKESELQNPAGLRATIENMYQYILCLTKPDGSLPLLGHSYRLSAVSHLQKGFKLLGNPFWRYVASRGKEGVCPPYDDTRLTHSPHFVMRTSWIDPNGLYLLIKGTTRGRPGTDGFNLDFYAYGRTLLPDSGAYSYNEPWREVFASTRNHSTVTVDHADQKSGEDVELIAWEQTDTFSYFDGVLIPYDGVTHRRRVLMMRESPGYVIVLDDLEGDLPGVVSSRFWLPPEPSQVELDQTALAARTRTENQADVLVQEVVNRDARMYLEEGWFSETYGSKSARKGLVVEAPSLPCSFGTLIYPFEKSREAPALRASWDSDTQSFVIHHDQGADQIRLHPGFGLPDVHRTLKGE